MVVTKEERMCWICCKTKPVFARMGFDEFPVCKDCYVLYGGKIRQCSGCDGECSAPILGEDVDNGVIRCQECEEHHWEQDPDYEEDFSKSDE